MYTISSTGRPCDVLTSVILLTRVTHTWCILHYVDIDQFLLVHFKQVMSVESLLVLLALLAGFASQGGRATMTYQPTSLKGDGQDCPSDEMKAQVIQNFHNLIEERLEIKNTEITALNTAVETLHQKVAEVSKTSQTANATQTELRQKVAELSNNSQTINTLLSGLNEEIPAASCQQILDNTPAGSDLPSGNFWITSSNGTAVQVYCDMQCCNDTTVDPTNMPIPAPTEISTLVSLPQCHCMAQGTRIANLDMTDPNQQCPPAWTLITTPVRTCGRTSSTGCDSVIFPTNGITYRRVCGQIKAYQVGRTNSFIDSFISDSDDFNSGQIINSDYVDGVSITQGSPRQHVWTFAAAQYEYDTGLTCFCINPAILIGPQYLPPPFIGDDYFCETGADARPSRGEFLSDDPLWDGEGCGPTSTCCELNNPPWFCKRLPDSTNDDIEVRICVNRNKDIAIEQIEVYIS